QQGTIDDVGGDSPTAPIITIHGPIQRPWLEGPGWRLDLNTELAYDQSLVVDPRPWANTVIRSDGTSLGGALSMRSRLSQVRLTPGSASVKFGGNDATKTS